MDKDQIRRSIAWRKENNLPQIPGDSEALNQPEEGGNMATEETHPIDEDEDPAEVEEADPDEDPTEEDEDPDEDPADEDED